MTRELIRAAVLRAVEICRNTEPQSHAPVEAGGYSAAVGPVVLTGPAAGTMLRELSEDKTLDALQRRIAAILAERIVHPEPFAAVADQMKPAQDDPLERYSSPAQASNRWTVPMVPPAPQLVHPAARKTWSDYLAGRDRVRAAFAARLAAAANPDKVGPGLYEERTAEERSLWRNEDFIAAMTPPRGRVPPRPAAARPRRTLGLGGGFAEADSLADAQAIRPLPDPDRRSRLGGRLRRSPSPGRCGQAR